MASYKAKRISKAMWEDSEFRQSQKERRDDPEWREMWLKSQRTSEVRENRSKAVTQAYLDGKFDGHHAVSGHFFSEKNNKEVHYRSSYELVAYEILEQLSVVRSYEVEPFGIQYEYRKSKHYTIPDILVTYMDGSKELIEVKPSFKLRRTKERAKLRAMKEHAESEGWDFSVWTEGELGLN